MAKCKFCGAEVTIGETCKYCGSVAEKYYYPATSSPTKIQKGSERRLNPDRTYTVKTGDCLYAIAKEFYGNGCKFDKITQANPEIRNPNLIYPGEILKIPF